VSGGPIVAVLAGGRSSRMGAEKAGVVIAGKTMQHHVLAAADATGLDMIVVGGAGGVADRRGSHLGPLAGLEAALSAAAGSAVIIAGVDQPWLRTETLLALAAADGDAVVPVDDGHLQVTCARYGHGCLAAVTALLDSGGRSLRQLVHRLQATIVAEAEWRQWGEDGRSWFSVNTEHDLEAGLLAFGPPGTLPP
jgi:molybdopterin-guanine dinucleotide biosynthesis protein A